MALEQGLDVLVVFHGAGVEHELVEAGREGGGDDPQDFLAVHAEDAVESPDGGRSPEGAGGESATLEISNPAGEPRREVTAEPNERYAPPRNHAPPASPTISCRTRPTQGCRCRW